MTDKEEFIQMSCINVSEWSVEDVGDWLKSVGLQKYVETFQLHNIDGAALVQLTEEDLNRELNVQVYCDIKKLSTLISKLKLRYDGGESLHSMQWQYGNLSISPADSMELRSHSKSLSMASDSDNSGSESSPLRSSQSSIKVRNSNGFATNLRPEYSKTILASIYLMSAGLANNTLIIFLQNDIHIMKNYAPLPDLFLDNFPYIWWAKPLSEIIITALMIILITTMYFHKHRFILLRRCCLILGSIYFLRAATIYITRLPVPSTSTDCTSTSFNSTWDIVKEAGIILGRGGLRIHGVKTCGDYLFSGHASAMTLFNFMITEYTPRHYYFLHITTWLLNIFGMFFILAAHGHYSIDVLIAFCITSRLFLYYHALVNNRALHQYDSYRLKIWFPLFSYFEANVNGIVPNEYSNLLSPGNVNLFIKKVPIFLDNAKNKCPQCLKGLRVKFPDVLYPARVLRRTCRFSF